MITQRITNESAKKNATVTEGPGGVLQKTGSREEAVVQDAFLSQNYKYKH